MPYFSSASNLTPTPMMADAPPTAALRTALESLEITDTVYEDLWHTWPLAQAVVEEVTAALPRGGALLLVGANSLLAETLLRLGYQVTLWRFGEQVLVGRARAAVVATIDANSTWPEDGAGYDGIVCTLILEKSEREIDTVLQDLAKRLVAGGALLVAADHPGQLKRRLGRVSANASTTSVSWNWPSGVARQLLDERQWLAKVSAAGFTAERVRHILGQRAAPRAVPIPLGRYAQLQVKHLALLLLPAVRDYLLLRLRKGADQTDDPAALPSVSVIIPTRNRAASLVDTLAALERQAYPADRMEIIVVDDESTDGTEGAVRGATEHTRFPIRYFRQSRRGPAAARNYGIGRANGAILAFTDSDCHPTPEWIINGVQRMTPGVGLVTGPVRPFVHPARVPSFFLHQTQHIQDDGIYPTANAFYRRSTVEEAGGFDEAFGAYRWGPPVHGEDIDLAWRVRRAGYRAVFTPDAPVDHEASSVSPRAWLIDPVRLHSVVLLMRRFPEFRRSHLKWGLFLDPRNPAFYAAFLGVVGAIRWRRAAWLLATLPFLWLTRGWLARDVWPPSRWWRLPLKLGLVIERCLVQTVVLMLASAYHRTVVL